MKIGVFDSGIGGLTIAKALEKGLPEHQIVFVNDSAHMPYGNKSPGELLALVTPIFEDLVQQGCDIIVIACNTVSTTLASRLREQFRLPLVAIEPMVKPAALQTKTGVIAVCATPATLKSERYHWLKDTYAPNTTVLEPDCSTWAAMIEHDQLDESLIRTTIEAALAAEADIIVLGCTHYHWIEDEIKAITASRVTILQPEQAIVVRVSEVLKQLS